MYQLSQGDCLDLLKTVESHSIDMVLADLPYGITGAEWDKSLPLDKLWHELNRVIAPHGNLVFFGQNPFFARLICSNLPNFVCYWVWLKNTASNFLDAWHNPLRQTEEIAVFKSTISTRDLEYPSKAREYLQSEKRRLNLTCKDLHKVLHNYMFRHYFANSQFSLPSPEDYRKLQTTGGFTKPYEELKQLFEQDTANLPTCKRVYNPQGIKKIEEPLRRKKHRGSNIFKFKDKQPIAEWSNFPRNVLQFDRETTNLHPTQKPIALLEYLIKTYTHEGGIVLDPTMGSGSTGVAAINLNRKFIGFEIDTAFYKLAEQRITETYKSKGKAA